MSQIKQEYREVNGIRKSVCCICNEVINYPSGVYFRNGIEVHCDCVVIARMRRGKITGIDK